MCHGGSRLDELAYVVFWVKEYTYSSFSKYLGFEWHDDGRYRGSERF
jgi:hypothetical protein